MNVQLKESHGSARTNSSAPNESKDEARGRRFFWWQLSWVFSSVLALAWFLVRVIPKPSRAGYPCQRAACPVASAFVLWLLAIIGTRFSWKKSLALAQQHRWPLAILAGISAAIAAIIVVGALPEIPVGAEPLPHSTLGVGQGVHPGRVVWVHAPEATDWEGYESADPWWDEKHTDASVVEAMTRRAVCELAGTEDLATAWDALFRSFNAKRGKGDVPYAPGEKVAIKINLTTCTVDDNQYNKLEVRNADTHWRNTIDNSPQMLLTLLRQLVNVAHVAQSDIAMGDPTGLFPNHLYEPIHAEFPDVVCFDRIGRVGSGRTRTEFSTVEFYWSTPDAEGKLQDYVPEPFATAAYLINCAILKTHSTGVTLCAKNHYGSLLRTPDGSLRGGPKQNYFNTHLDLPGFGGPGDLGHYRPLVDLMGHKELGGKTLLYFVDGLFSGQGWESKPVRWSLPPFGNGSEPDWPNSLFVSQDPVAIDSVCYDFLMAEMPQSVGGALFPEGGPEDYLHEAALADLPPSGTFYDPEKDGVRMTSLGAHEHWNNPLEKQYSRNRGLNQGIELLGITLARPEIVKQPRSRTNVVTSALMLSVEALSEDPLSYQWFKGADPVPGAVSRTLVLANVQLADAGVYSVVVSNFAGAVTSAPSVLIVEPITPPEILAGPVSNPATARTYYLLEQSTWVEARHAAASLFGELTTLDDAAEQDWVFDTFANWGGQQRLLWIGLSDSDPVNNVPDPESRQTEFVWSNGEPPAFANWQPGEPDNENEAGGFYVHLNPPSHASPGSWNDSVDTDRGTLPFHGVVEVPQALPVDLPPEIVRGPVPHTNVVGSALLLAVTARGTEPLAYQWFKNNDPVPGADSRVVVIPNVQPVHAGTYFVSVTNAVSSVTSLPAEVIVLPARIPGVLTGPITNSANGHAYYLLDQSTWVEAEAAAQSMGGHLATIHSQAEQEFVYAAFANWNGQPKGLWIGLNDADPVHNTGDQLLRGAEFVWASGDAHVFDNWDSSEPNNYREWGEFYVHMLPPGVADAGKWNDTWDAIHNGQPLHGVVEIPFEGSTRPVLSIVLAAEQVTLSWPAEYAGFRLEQNLSSPWSPEKWVWIDTDPQTSSGRHHVTITNSSISAYYRLRKP